MLTTELVLVAVAVLVLLAGLTWASCVHVAGCEERGGQLVRGALWPLECVAPR